MICDKEEDYSKLIADLKEELKEKIKEQTTQEIEIRKLYSINNKKKAEIKDKKKLLQTYEIKESVNTIFYQDIQNIPNFKLLTKDDLFKISKAIDKTNYNSTSTSNGKYHRFIDLENVVKYIIQVKEIYPLWNLTYVKKFGKIDTYPPKNYYIYHFTTPEGLIFSNVNNELPLY